MKNVHTIQKVLESLDFQIIVQSIIMRTDIDKVKKRMRSDLCKLRDLVKKYVDGLENSQSEVTMQNLRNQAQSLLDQYYHSSTEIGLSAECAQLTKDINALKGLMISLPNSKHDKTNFVWYAADPSGRWFWNVQQVSALLMHPNMIIMHPDVQLRLNAAVDNFKTSDRYTGGDIPLFHVCRYYLSHLNALRQRLGGC
jgi:hypothetical protein